MSLKIACCTSLSRREQPEQSKHTDSAVNTAHMEHLREKLPETASSAQRNLSPFSDLHQLQPWQSLLFLFLTRIITYSLQFRAPRQKLNTPCWFLLSNYRPEATFNAEKRITEELLREGPLDVKEALRKSGVYSPAVTGEPALTLFLF